MKRALLFIFMTVCVLGLSACSSKDAMPETSDSASNPVQNTDISNLNGGKIWSCTRENIDTISCSDQIFPPFRLLISVF